MNLLITGGLGLIGMKIVEALASSNTRVVTFGRSPLPDSISLPANAVHETGSILVRDRLVEVMKGHRITHVVHAAGARTGACGADPLLAIESNVLGTNILFGAAIEAGSVEKIVFLSTAALYGKVDQKIDETHPMAPPGPYAISKAAAEIIATGHAGESHLETAIVRPGFVMNCGESEQETSSRINTMIHSAMTDEVVERKLPPRLFLHSSVCLAESIVELLNHSGAKGTFHLPGISLSIEAFGEELKKVAGSVGRSPRIELRPDHELPVPADLDFSRFARLTGSGETPDLEAMIRSAISQGD